MVCGGKVELGEALVQALSREVMEEVGLAISNIKLIAIYEFIFEQSFFQRRHFIFFDYYCLAKSTKVKLQKEEAEKSIWIMPKKALGLPIEKYTRMTIKKILKSKKELKIN